MVLGITTTVPSQCSTITVEYQKGNTVTAQLKDIVTLFNILICIVILKRYIFSNGTSQETQN